MTTHADDRTSPDVDPAPAARRRGEVLEHALLDAAWDVLADQGYAGFTYDAVAARAGTSKPVLYRRWPQRTDLLLAAMARYYSQNPVEFPDTGSLREDALAALRNIDRARSGIIAMITAQLIEFHRHSGLTLKDVRDAIGEVIDLGSPLRLAIERAVARGEIADRPRNPHIVDLPFDLIRHDVILTMAPMAPGRIEEIVDEIWLPLL